MKIKSIGCWIEAEINSLFMHAQFLAPSYFVVYEVVHTKHWCNTE